jgi:malonyl-CoA O-methyltransferase
MTFEVVYGHAFKGAPRASADGETKVSLADMRAMVRAPKGSR